MDPLSITVATLALIGAANQVAVGLNKLASLKGAPAAILALNNEVSDLRLVLQETEPLLLKHKQADGLGQPNFPPKMVDATFLRSMDRAKEKLLDLESVIQNRLMTRMGAIDKLGWLREQDKVRKAQADLRTVRLNITAALGVVTSSTSFRLETQLQELHLASEQGQAIISHKLTSHGDALDKAFTSIMETQQKHDQRLKKLESAISPNLLNPALTRQADSSSTGQSVPPRRYSDSPDSLFFEANFSALLAESVKWFLARILSLVVKFQDAQTPEVSLRLLNVRSSCESIFQHALHGDAESMKFLLNNGKGSVLDVTDDSGHSPLHVWDVQHICSSEAKSGQIAVSKSHVEVIDILLRMGSEPTPYDMAWSTIYCFQGTPNAANWRVDEIRTLFPTLEYVEDRRKFTKLHQIVLQILHIDLEKELLRNRSAIDQEDADGRTPLSWAAARGDNKAVETLLRHGASPNVPDRIGQGPLRQSIKAHDASCTKLLLAYGANVDHTDNWKQTALQSALYYTDPVSFLIPLLAAGSKVNTRDSRGNTPLIEACIGNHPDAVRLLLDHGAEVNCANDTGVTPLHQCVRFNSHEALGIILNTDVQHSPRDRCGFTVLHWAAEWADIRTLGLLRQARLRGVHVEDKRADGLTAIDVAEQRRQEKHPKDKQTADSIWITAFGDFLESLAGFATPKSTYTGSDVSDDFFVDALQSLTSADIVELAEKGSVPHV
ncbi:hypothetical protein MMC22_000993 [Lobaria immixta]|nr:hypothetical protein [Lobaria immixta]